MVAVLAAALYARTIAFGFTDTDDRDLLVDDHARLVDPSIWRDAFRGAYMHVVDPAHAYYRPLVTLSYAVDARLSGLSPAGYHATNVLLHAIASALVLLLLRRLAIGAGVALAAAFVFAASPALAPAVAWVPGRNDVLLAIFAALAWLAFARDRKWLHLACFAAALLTKETAICVPIVCTLHAFVFERRPPRAIVPYAIGWTALVALRVLVHPAGALHVAANVDLFVASFGALALPFEPKTIAVADDLPLWPGALAIVAFAAAMRFVRRARLRLVVLGLGACAASLAPAILVAGPLVLGPRLYLPAVGFVVALAAIAQGYAPSRRALVALTATTLAVFGVITLASQDAFRDRRAFAKNAALASPHSALAHFAYGQSLQTDGDRARALEEYRLAIALGPAEVAHNNVAVLHMADARWSEAEAELRAELALNSRFAKAHYNLAIVLRREERLPEACAAITRAVELGLEDDAARAERARDCSPQ